LPNSVVYSFEPGAAAFRELTDRTAELADVHVFHLAVGAASGPQTLIETDYSDMSSFLQPSPANWSSAVAKTVVHVTTLDEFCAAEGIESIDLLKIDTQGYELEVLRGAPGLISGGAIRLIYLEVNFAELYEGLPSFDMLFRFLVDRGFRLVALYNYRSFAEPSSAASWCDALFTRA
jgi:FkbM family methyltransferase